jgi:hypothetical protein
MERGRVKEMEGCLCRLLARKEEFSRRGARMNIVVTVVYGPSRARRGRLWCAGARKGSSNIALASWSMITTRLGRRGW